MNRVANSVREMLLLSASVILLLFNLLDRHSAVANLDAPIGGTLTSEVSI